MLEIILGIGVIIVMVKIADNDDLSGIIWGGLTLLVLAASLLIPLPFLRFLIAGVLVFVGMIIYKVVANK